MDDLIRREAAIEALEQVRWALWGIDIPSPTVPEYIEHHKQVQEVMSKIDEMRSKIEAMPSAEKTGKWIPVTNGRGGFECNKCHNYAPSYQDGVEWLSDFCPNCGARMVENNV